MLHDSIQVVHAFDATEEYKEQFNALMREAFGFSFEAWHARGLWNEDYTCYSILDGGVMQANASLYRMRLLVNGGEQIVYQLGAVATRADCRGRGLSRRILDFIIAQRPEEPFFLCADETVLDFYPRFGFTPLPSWQPRFRRNLGAHPGEMRSLVVDDACVADYLPRRADFSRRLDCANAAPIAWFHLLLAYPGSLYEIPALGCLVVAEQMGSLLSLVDVVATAPLAFEALAGRLDFPGVEEVRFAFNPDWLGVDPEWAEVKDDPLFVRGGWKLKAPFILPWMIRT